MTQKIISFSIQGAQKYFFQTLTHQQREMLTMSLKEFFKESLVVIGNCIQDNFEAEAVRRKQSSDPQHSKSSTSPPQPPLAPGPSPWTRSSLTPPPTSASSSAPSQAPQQTNPGRSGPLPAASQSSTSAPQPPSSAPKRESKYLSKPRILYVGDSVAQNIDPRIIEKNTGSRLTTAKAYSSIEDNRSRWPRKNVQEVTNKHLDGVSKEDKFAHLILGAPTVDITNLNTSGVKPEDNTEFFKKEVVVSCMNIFSTAQNALTKHPNLKSVTIMEHPPRYDNVDVDPSFLKHKLAKYASDVFRQLWSTSSLRHKIVLGLSQGLECSGKVRLARYTRTHDIKHDGIHMYGVSGRAAFCRSVTAIINSVLSPHSAPEPVTPQSETAQGAGATNTGGQDRYNVEVNNIFNILGN